MKYLIAIVIITQAALFARSAVAQNNWQSSPLNYQNSELNFNNSPLNYNNSPLNYQNSPLNSNATNGIFDTSGNRLGYEVQAPTGVTNIFDNNGNRIGYTPSRR